MPIPADGESTGNCEGQFISAKEIKAGGQGMTRIAELQKEYPSVHPDLVVMWEAMASGVKDNSDIDKISNWSRGTQGSYQAYEGDYTLKRMAEETPWRVKEKENQVLRAGAVYMKSGVGFSVRRSEQSPYTIRELSEGKFGLFEGEEKVDVDIFPLLRKPERTKGEPLTSKGTPIGDLVALNRRCYIMWPVRFCEYFTTGEECQFCNFNPTQDEARAIGLRRPVTINAEETAEAFKIHGSQVRLLEGLLESGGFEKAATEASVNVRFVDKCCSSLPYTTHMKLVAEAMPRQELRRLKDAGLSGVRFQMETTDQRLFPLMLPGKARHMSYEAWLEAFQDALDIFGEGNVACKLVGGLTLLGPHGLSVEDSRDSHIEGFRWMISHGILPAFQGIRWAPGSPFSKDPANREKMPKAEFFLDLVMAHHQTMKEFGLYEKISRFLYCGLDCHTGFYIGQQGMVETAGDMGTWMAGVLPYEENWFLQFLDSVRTPATVTTR